VQFHRMWKALVPQKYEPDLASRFSLSLTLQSENYIVPLSKTNPPPHGVKTISLLTLFRAH
jgi:hypothetical protein